MLSSFWLLTVRNISLIPVLDNVLDCRHTTNYIVLYSSSFGIYQLILVNCIINILFDGKVDPLPCVCSPSGGRRFIAE